MAKPAELRACWFAAGSMGPKVEAACRFVEATGGRAAIGTLTAAAILRGQAGTTVARRAGQPLMPYRGALGPRPLGDQQALRSHPTATRRQPLAAWSPAEGVLGPCR